LPGYYNSAYGITISFTPSQNWYLSLGSYDGNLANGTQTGLTGPHFNGSYFNIAETGFSWFIGKNKLPGTVGVGAWHQTGLIQESSMLFEHGASGYYLFGSQRLWYKNPGINNGGISAFYQYGENNSSVLPMKKYVGAGLTFFGLIPSRENDSMGMGTAFSWLNQKSFSRKTELMLQAYYQAKIINGIFLEPALSYIPTPGAQPNLHAAWVATMRLIVLF
jgi:porin